VDTLDADSAKDLLDVFQWPYAVAFLRHTPYIFGDCVEDLRILAKC
jgi:hypothetical protein